MTPDYIKGYNDALADVRLHYHQWYSDKLRDVTDPIVVRREVDLADKLCCSLRKEISNGCSELS